MLRKGQVTIPKEIRDRLGIVPGSEVDFLPTEDGIRVVAVDENISEEEASGNSASCSIKWPVPWIGRHDDGRMYGVAEGST